MGVNIIDEFKANVKGYAVTNRYRLVIPKFFDGIPYQYYVKEVEKPGKELKTSSTTILGNEISIAQGIDFDPLTVTFFDNDKLDIKRRFDNWFDKIFIKDTWTVSFKSEYAVDMYLEILNLKMELVERIKFVSAYPREISTITFSYENDNTPCSFTVTFLYFSYYTVDE